MMGCVAGKLDINDVHPNTFAVLNIDEKGSKLSPGQIEITDYDLVWHQKGKTAIRWPLKSLRRYGFETDMFSFESGRRCQTGPGIYAFRCRRAENLFNLLQLKIRAGDTDRGDGGSPTVDDPGSPRWPPSSLGFPTPTAMSRPSLTEASMLSETSYLLSEEIGGGAKPYVNCDIPEAISATTTAAQLPSQAAGQPAAPVPAVTAGGGRQSAHSASLPPLNLNPVAGARVPPLHPEQTPDTPSHQYENVVTGDFSPMYNVSRYSFSLPPKPSTVISQQQQQQLPVTPPHTQLELSTLPSLPNSPTSPNPELKEEDGRPLNYILLDLDSNSDNSQQSANGSKRGGIEVGYTTIDFDKTAALIKSTNQRYEDDEPGLRKTRHNSSISDINSTFKSVLSPTE